MGIFDNFAADVAALVAVCMVLGLVSLASAKIERSKGKNLTAHAAFLAVTVCSYLFIPMWIKDSFFTPLTIVVVGTGTLHVLHVELFFEISSTAYIYLFYITNR